MKWRQDLPADWNDAPDDPPAEDRGVVVEALVNGLLVRDRADQGAYLYSIDAVDVEA